MSFFMDIKNVKIVLYILSRSNNNFLYNRKITIAIKC